MANLRETFITVGLLGICGGVTGMNVVPKLLTQQASVAHVQNDITVSVSGAVNRPGAYTLPWGAQTQDAVAAAGGLTPEADPKLVNLAAPLDAGESVFVATLQAETGDLRVSINSASGVMLETLSGVGPKTAQLIIEGRPYNAVEDLLDVKGIGPKTLEKLRGSVTL